MSQSNGCTLAQDLKVVCGGLASRLDPGHQPSKLGRLSWPDANDKRRARVAHPPSPLQERDVRGNDHEADMHIVHVSQQDLQMHYHFSRAAQDASTRPHLKMPLSWKPFQLDVADQELFQHFLCDASQSLAIIGHNPVDLGHALVRIASADDTDSARAVRLSILAFSSTHRHHIYAQPVELKISALEALATVPCQGFSTKEAIQHVAAGMLLCSLEIHHTSCTSGQWIHYLDGVKKVIQSTGLAGSAYPDPDLAILLDWVYYHEILVRFTQRYWPTLGVGKKDTFGPEIKLQVSHQTPPALAIVDLLSEVCDAVSTRVAATTSLETSQEHKSFLKILDWKIRNLSIPAIAEDNTSDGLMTAEVYKLAMLVYLSRASNDTLSQTAVTQQYIDQAFARFSQMGSCRRQFPLFILGCEARTDDQRATILDLMARTHGTVASRSLEHVTILMEATWAQEDLANGDINYTDKLSNVFSCCSNVPSFV
ncbi:fungal-specific transcription factor domain-containing protein [Nemania sp. NC0429]|nr:fungal-specific transcription factor domain-containing protein [Nemania sp. NC0429]